jgi:hypothetical protein
VVIRKKLAALNIELEWYDRIYQCLVQLKILFLWYLDVSNLGTIMFVIKG